MSSMENSEALDGNRKSRQGHDDSTLEKMSRILSDFSARNPELKEVVPAIYEAYLCIARSLASGGTLFLCGNGGSLSDALHMSGELLKSYLMPRPLNKEHRMRLLQQPHGDILANNLEQGLRVIVLGNNAVFTSAVGNDNLERSIEYAQHLWVMGRSGDVVMGISTSGKAKNVCYAISTGKALDLHTIGLTGKNGGPLAQHVDIAIRVPEERTDRIQEQHVRIYHVLCEMLEQKFFGR